jgi:hypothetical protein
MRQIPVIGVLVCSLLYGVTVAAQSTADRSTAQAEIDAGEKTIIGAILKNDPKTFHANVLPDSYAFGDAGPIKVGDFDKMMAQMATDCKIVKWSVSDSTYYWLNPTTVVHMFKTEVDGTCQGQRVPTVWASSVWSKKDGKWLGAFHQETVVAPAPPTPPKK